MKLPISTEDKTLIAIDKAIETKEDVRRTYLGMSSLGHECERYLWYNFRWAGQEQFTAKTLRIFEDGHRTEDLMASRICAAGFELTGQQDGWSDFGGHLKGHCDGIIKGLIQAPNTPHIWENKAVNEKKFEKLKKLRAANEKTALSQWDKTYYAQQILYMDYSGLDRAWMTVTTPGGRDHTAVRTEADPAHAMRLRAKAERIIFNDNAPDRVSNNEKIPPCVWCSMADICRGRQAAERNCRTCVHVSVEQDGTWKCAKFNTTLTEQDGCEHHRYNPAFVPGKAVNASKEENWIEYEMEDGSVWRDKDSL